MKEYKLYGISRNTDFKLEGVEMFIGDLKSREFLKSIEFLKFYAIIHCSAEVDVNLCEIDKEWAYESNVTATDLIFSLLNSDKYFYISTDSVFDGKVGDYSEDSLVNPLSYYAETKLLGEQAVKRNTINYYILRTNIYGFSTPMKKSLFEWGYSALKKGSNINGFSNMFFNPLYVGQLASFLGQLIQSNADFGIYNTTSTKGISKFDFLKKIAKEFHYSQDLIKSVEYHPSRMEAPRALNTTLNNDKIKSIFTNFDFSFEMGFSMLKSDLSAFNTYV